MTKISFPVLLSVLRLPGSPGCLALPFLLDICVFHNSDLRPCLCLTMCFSMPKIAGIQPFFMYNIRERWCLRCLFPSEWTSFPKLNADFNSALRAA